MILNELFNIISKLNFKYNIVLTDSLYTIKLLTGQKNNLPAEAATLSSTKQIWNRQTNRWMEDMQCPMLKDYKLCEQVSNYVTSHTTQDRSFLRWSLQAIKCTATEMENNTKII